ELCKASNQTMPSPPEWLRELADAAALLMSPVDVMAPIGCHFCFVEGTWEVTLFASNTQIVGGKKDGVLRPSRFHVDVLAMMQLLTEVHDITWQPLAVAVDDELGPHIVISGLCGENDVSLQILARAPRRFEPGRRAIIYEHSFEENW